MPAESFVVGYMFCPPPYAPFCDGVILRHHGSKRMFASVSKRWRLWRGHIKSLACVSLWDTDHDVGDVSICHSQELHLHAHTYVLLRTGCDCSVV